MKMPSSLYFDKIWYSFGKNNNKNSLKAIFKNFPNNANALKEYFDENTN